MRLVNIVYIVYLLFAFIPSLWRLWLCGHYHGNAVALDEDLEVVTCAGVGSNINWTANAGVGGPENHKKTIEQPLKSDEHLGIDAFF